MKDSLKTNASNEMDLAQLTTLAFRMRTSRAGDVPSHGMGSLDGVVGTSSSFH